MKICFDSSKFRDDRVFTEKIFANDNLVIVLFYLKKGQKVSLHTSPSSVLTTVLKGKGRFFIDSEEKFEILNESESYLYEPKQPHGFEAIEDMVVQAVIAPNPAVFSKVKIG